MPETNPFTLPPTAVTTDRMATPKLSADRGENAEIAAIDTGTTNNSDVDDDNESEMDAHTPPTHDDRDRTATPPTDATGAERGRQGTPAPLADTPAGDGPSAAVTAPTHSPLT
jgi:hypothetical protein